MRSFTVIRSHFPKQLKVVRRPVVKRQKCPFSKKEVKINSLNPKWWFYTLRKVYEKVSWQSRAVYTKSPKWSRTCNKITKKPLWLEKGSKLLFRRSNDVFTHQRRFLKSSMMIQGHLCKNPCSAINLKTEWNKNTCKCTRSIGEFWWAQRHLHRDWRKKNQRKFRFYEKVVSNWKGKTILIKTNKALGIPPNSLDVQISTHTFGASLTPSQ